uniref:Uncharacterized protein n=1 Tax=Candidatus Kentrum eta TaxID=2126337 RepID=A0A450U7V2_9GAMM|nr:MAG: hypothetical protein BECKH772A_GA0070896_100069 [Candidatus Kentron sp. H]VFJ89937.1 MAG: hypothetical protein BECKH772B_GA0070898_100079 [Candidatus Kentron sp. H]VFJ96317.1 MAG: hypothetical protein BECKH772C_GA0070978_100069 [Candidatus Kentron sp. H]
MGHGTYALIKVVECAHWRTVPDHWDMDLLGRIFQLGEGYISFLHTGAALASGGFVMPAWRPALRGLPIVETIAGDKRYRSAAGSAGLQAGMTNPPAGSGRAFLFSPKQKIRPIFLVVMTGRLVVGSWGCGSWRWWQLYNGFRPWSGSERSPVCWDSPRILWAAASGRPGMLGHALAFRPLAGTFRFLAPDPAHGRDSRMDFRLFLSISGLKPWTSGLKLPVSGLKLSISSFKLPVSGRKLYISSLKLPISGRKSIRESLNLSDGSRKSAISSLDGYGEARHVYSTLGKGPIRNKRSGS